MNFISTLIGTPLGWIMWLCYTLVRNYGVALILFTLIARALQFPLSIKQQKSTAKMAVLKPKLDALQKRYGNDKEKYQQEMLNLYTKEGYNPMSGCLPMLIQFPILFGLIDVIYKPLKHILRIPADLITQATDVVKNLPGITFNTYSPEISIIHGVTQSPESFSFLGEEYLQKIAGFDLNFLGINLGEIPTFTLSLIVLIPILSGVTSLLSSIYTMKKNEAANPDAAGGGMIKGMTYIMPLFSVFFAFQVPAGVGFYWLLSNVFMFVQQVILNKMYDPKKIAEEARLAEEEQERLLEEERRQKRLEAKEKAKQLETGKKKTKEKAPPQEELDESALTQKELNRRRLAEARRRDAEKYGEEYVEVTDEDLK